jgi:protein O-GlcNAc transferase
MFSFLRKSDLASAALSCHQRGVDFLQQNNIEQSLVELDKAVRLAPGNAKYFNSLGTTRKAAGNLADAESSYRRAIELDPAFIAPLYNLALLLRESGRIQEAEQLFGRLHEQDPNDAEVLFQLGYLLAARWAFGEAISMYEKALQLSPDNPHIWLHMAYAHHSTPEHIEDAMRCLQKCISLQPDLAEAHVRLGLIYEQAFELDQAERCYRFAINLDPKQPRTHYDLGNILYAMGKWNDAVLSYRETVRLAPDFGLAYSNIGSAMVSNGQIREAIDYFKRAIAVQSDAIDAYINLGAAYSTYFKQHSLAKETFETALRIEPDNVTVKRCLIGEMQHMCDWSGFDELLQAYRESINIHPDPPTNASDVIYIPNTAAEQLHQVKHYVKRTYGSIYHVRRKHQFTFDQQPCGRLRIGYLSYDFRNHALAHLLSELIELHDRTQFEIVAYSFSVDDNSEARNRLANAFDAFVDIRALSHTDAARKIYADGVDIVVDLMGHTEGARTGILVMRPAPIQVNYLGYPGTMGADFMDYIISDRIVTPPGHEVFYAEKIVTLPGSYQVNDRKRPIGPVTNRADFGLPDSTFIFCCFNRNSKILPGMFAAWMRILQRVPTGLLWLVESNRWAAENMRSEAKRHGISADRLIFAPILPIDQHLSRLRVADLFLDTSPYGAHTTASDALWMGLPVITCIGETFASRVAASLLHAVGIPELVTNSMDEYVDLATRLALNPDELKRIKGKLLENRTTAPLFDTPAYARNLETAYRKMWENHLSGNGPQPIHL